LFFGRRCLSCGMKNYNYSFETERLFKESGPFFHVCSKPVADVIFHDDAEKNLAVLYLAIAARETKTVVLSYYIMSNHVHVLLKGYGPKAFYERFASLVNNYMRRHGRKDSLLPTDPTIVPVNTLAHFKEEVAYILRNRFVVDSGENPFTSVWSSGFLYFNPRLEELFTTVPYVSSEQLSKRKVMQLTCTTDGALLPPGLRFINGYLDPSCFVDYKLVELLFVNARQFVFSMFKNVESQAEVAQRLGEEFFLPDEEAYKVAWKYSKTTWAIDDLKKLGPIQKRELAKHMKLTYSSSNGQLVRITGLTEPEVNALFPLSAKPDQQK